MIEARASVNENVTPKEITTSMIDQDLKDGLKKSEMMEKYNIRKWEIDKIFKNPKLTNRKPSPRLSFTFIDDMPDEEYSEREILKEEPRQVSKQVTVDQVIEEVTDSGTDIGATAGDISPITKTDSDNVTYTDETIDPEVTVGTIEEVVDEDEHEDEMEEEEEFDTFTI
jgi:hypothetical protein